MSESFPKFYSHPSNDKLPNRVAHKPADAVNLEARGYKVVDTKAAQKVADKVSDPKPTAPKPSNS